MFNQQDWLNLIIRWFHITAGIAWIGSSFYFIWLDYSLRPPQEQNNKKKAKNNALGEVWSVHGGGFYHVQKFQNDPKKMPASS